MKFYHGSKDSNIKQLNANHTKDGFVYATSSRLVALTYAGRCFPNLFSSMNGKEYFWELKPKLFEKMTKGKSAYIYTLEEKEFKPISQNLRCGHQHCYRVSQDVNVVGREFIPDVYDELMKYESTGEFVLMRYENIDETKRKMMIAEIVKCVKSISDDEINNKENFWHIF